MTPLSWLQLAVFLVVLLSLAYPLGIYIAAIFDDRCPRWMRWMQWFERLIYRVCAVDPTQEMGWKTYGLVLLGFNGLGLVGLFCLQRWQSYLPLNPQHLAGVEPGLAFNNAVSFVTNTDWQAYAGETTLSIFTQMLGLTSQNFLSAATGLSLLMALIRGITRQRTDRIGHCVVDLTRGTLYVLLPLSFIFALCLVSQGVIQTLQPPVVTHLISPFQSGEGLQSQRYDTTTIPLGPVASQIAIKQLGSNGGGFFNANAAHPFENPTAFTNVTETLAMLLIPAALCVALGVMVGARRQGLVLLMAMVLFFVGGVVVAAISESQRPDSLAQAGIQFNGNYEGKEVRFGIFGSVLWSIATTSSSNGSVNSLLDSYMPIGGLMPLWMMHLGEVIFGGVGSGLYGMLMMVLLTVFIAGLMVGRTPEYLGKKIEPFEMKMASLAILIMPVFVLLMTAISLVLPTGVRSLLNPGAHGLTEMLYAWTSLLNNNGSSFSGLDAHHPYFYLLGGVGMLIGRYGVALPILAIAGSLASKKTIPSNAGTLQTETPMFWLLLICVIALVGALSFLPVLALGPIAEGLIDG